MSELRIDEVQELINEAYCEGWVEGQGYWEVVTGGAQEDWYSSESKVKMDAMFKDEEGAE